MSPDKGDKVKKPLQTSWKLLMAMWPLQRPSDNTSTECSIFYPNKNIVYLNFKVQLLADVGQTRLAALDVPQYVNRAARTQIQYARPFVSILDRIVDAEEIMWSDRQGIVF